MRFTASIDYPADPATVAEMLADDAFVADKIRASRASEGSHEVVRDGAGFTVTTRRLMPAELVPEKFRSFVRGGIDVRTVEAWQAPAADGSRTATLALEIAGMPVKVTGTMNLAPGGQGTVQTFDGDVKASVPLVGGTIERAAVGAVEKVVDVERRVGMEHLARR